MLFSQKHKSDTTTSEPFDVVIPAHEKDLLTLNHAIRAIRKNVCGARRIIVVSKEKYTDLAEWFDEALYPFSYQEIASLVSGSIGWNFQQLLKLYSLSVIPDILPNVLVVDADTIFLRRVNFFEGKTPLYNLSKDRDLEQSDFHQVSKNHIQKIVPQIAERLPELFRERSCDGALAKFLNRLNFANETDRKKAEGLESGICHHMIFQKNVIEDLFKKVEEADGSGDKFYKVFLKKSSQANGVAEYNLYFYFLISHYPQAYKIRLLRYKNTANFNLLKEWLRRKYDYCSYHSYMR